MEMVSEGIVSYDKTGKITFINSTLEKMLGLERNQIVGSYYEVTSHSHEEALNIYGKAQKDGQPFSLIIIDLTMRGDEGGETAIRKWLAIYPEVKALISSGYINDPVIEEYWKYGFAGALMKPYTLTDLKKALEKILEKGNN